MARRIYLTRCSRAKALDLRDTGEVVTPERLYTATTTLRFMSTCRERGVEWAIFSDFYGVWFPTTVHSWYEKDPRTVTLPEFKRLVADFDEKLAPYSEIWFYRNPGGFNPLYQRLIQSSVLRDRVHYFSKKAEIL